MALAVSITAFALLAVSVACSSAEPTAVPAPTATPAPTSTPVPEKINVVATTSIIADWVREVGGDRVTVKELVPRLSDPHNFQPGARDVADVADADLVFVNGLELEGQWLVDLVRNAATDTSKVVDLSEGIPVLGFEEDDGHDDHGDEDDHDHDEDAHDEDEDHADGDDHDEDGHDDDEDHAHDEDDDDHADEDHDDDDHDEDAHGEDDDDHAHDDHDEDAHGEDDDDHAHDDDEGGHDDHAHGEFDPHFWMSPLPVKVAVHTIEERLSELDTSSASMFHERAEAYMAQLDELDTWIAAQVVAIPSHDRLLVTTHDALGYFAERYGFSVVGAVIPGGGTTVSPTPAELTALAEQIETLGINVVFSEAQLPEALTITLANEAGAKVVSGLTPGSLGRLNSPSGNYIGMMRHNTEIIVNALTGA